MKVMLWAIKTKHVRHLVFMDVSAPLGGTNPEFHEILELKLRSSLAVTISGLKLYISLSSIIDLLHKRACYDLRDAGDQKMPKAQLNRPNINPKRQTWSQEKMAEAVSMVRDKKMGLKKAAKFYEVPKNSFANKRQNTQGKATTHQQQFK
uniref:(California timema) hypothetical protein n=1 Tax=Timema californicum TaxID=61474 RepID=A0A7R9JAS3_TIMCA|nr:unnamed protein product [Timema californicum]